MTLCDVSTATPSMLETIFKDGSRFRDLSALLATQFEIKACGARTNGLFDFLMANKRLMNERVIKHSLGPGNSEIMPFIMAGQKSVINDEYWAVTNISGDVIRVRSRHSIPLDVSWFVPGMTVFVFAKTAGGSQLRGAFKVVSAVNVSSGGTDYIDITTTSQNAGTLCAATKSNFSGVTTGFLVRGTNNVQDVESWCFNRPGLNPNKNIPFWWQTSRWTMCTDQYYEAWYKRLHENNDYFARFGDIDSAQRNKQYAERFQREWVNSVFWNKPISSNQTLANYPNLEQVNSFISDQGAAYGGIYVPGEGRCVGRRANAIGIYEQLCECGQVYDLQNQRLNLAELFEGPLYDLWRARGDQGIPNDVIEIYTDSFTANQIRQAMVIYYDQRSSGLARFMIDTKQYQTGQDACLGFKFDCYKLWYPNVTIRVVTHFFFDDFAAAAKAEDADSTGRFLWILDWTSIYPFIITSNRKVHRTGDIDKLGAIDYNYACVLENPTQEVSLNSLTWGVVVECPENSLIIEGFDVNKIPSTRSTTPPYTDIYDLA